jgi:anaerobic magnesium-protoporphyrin IX monomethyl ester cyclase
VNVLLINPPSLVSQNEVMDRFQIITPPLGLAYLAGMLEHHEYPVKILDGIALNLSLSRLKKTIKKEQPRIVGVTATTSQIYDALKVVKAAKEVCPECFTIIGGAHVTFLPIETMNDPLYGKYLDAVCIGEGEQTIHDLTKTLEKNGGDLSAVRGIAYRKNKSIKINEPRPLMEDLDSLPWPARHLLPMEKYKLLGKEEDIGHIYSSRGCPFNCIFCSSSKILGTRFRARSPQSVVDEFEYVTREYNPMTIEFADDLFTLNRKRVTKICRELRNRGLYDVAWACSSRINITTRKLLSEMKKAGCLLIYYGIESGSQRVLNIMKKQLRIEQIVKAVNWTQEAGLNILGSFLFGIPGETKAEMSQTIRFAKKLGLLYTQFSIATPYPGTELYKIAKENNYLITEDWSQYTSGKPIIETETFTAEDLRYYLRKAYVSFYLSPRVLLNQIREKNLFLFVNAAKLILKSKFAPSAA